jgi:hypothetical protein
MTYYLVREAGEPVALVASIDLACEIVSSQPPGYYIVDEIQAEALGSRPRKRARRHSALHPDERHGDCPGMISGADDSPPPQSRHTSRSTTPLITSDPESA